MLVPAHKIQTGKMQLMQSSMFPLEADKKSSILPCPTKENGLVENGSKRKSGNSGVYLYT